ncbi:hypothetical protein [Psychrobacter cryohalolentis]|uniref:hypothetical protein n=1 Tax=Psychrobacter cryohalolentis TaxID=330922 RepID=UPI003F8540B3
MRLPDLNDLIQDLQLAKQMAIEDNKPNALIMATIGQAKLLGIDKPIKDVTLIRDVEPQQTLDYSMLNDDELRQLIAITEKVEKAVLDKRIERARNEY